MVKSDGTLYRAPWCVKNVMVEFSNNYGMKIMGIVSIVIIKAGCWHVYSNELEVLAGEL